MVRTLTHIFILFTSVLFGQKTFTNTYNVDSIGNTKYSFDDSHIVFEYNNNFFTIGTFEENIENAGGITDGISDTTHGMLMKYNSKGNVLYRNFYTPNSCSANIYTSILKGDTLLGGGTIYSPKNFCGFYLPDNPPPNIDPITKNRIFFTATNLTTGTYRQAIFKTGVSSYPFGISQTNDGNFYIANMVEDDQSICLLKINSKLDSLSTKKLFDSVPDVFAPTYFDKNKNGFVMLLVSPTASSSHFQFLNEYADTTGYVDFPFVISAISKTSDGGYIAMTTETTTVPRLIKFDEDLNIEWQKNYAVYSNNFVKQTSDGNYILGGKNFSKVNKDSVIWTQRYFGTSNITPWYFLFDATETSDGGIAITGFYEANTLLIKTDCMGNLVWDNSSCFMPPTDTILPEAVFPNPFNNEITFQLSNLTSMPVTIRLVNMIGQIVFETISYERTFTINTTALADGVYFYSAMVGEKTYKKGKLVRF